MISRLRLYRDALIDVGAVTILLVLSLTHIESYYGFNSGNISVYGGALVGAILAFVAAWRGWSALGTAGIGAVVYLIAGAGIALPTLATQGFIPNLASSRVLLVQVVYGWVDALTVSPLLGQYPEMRVLPYFLGFVTALIAYSIALRGRRAWLAIIPLYTAGGIALLWGTQLTYGVEIRGLAFGVINFLWGADLARRKRLTNFSAKHTTGRVEHTNQSSILKNRWLQLTVLFTAAYLTAIVIAPAVVEPNTRWLLRDVVEPPVLNYDYPSPLSQFRSYVKDRRDEPIITVTGLPQEGRVRLAALDAYDGTVYNVSGHTRSQGGFSRVGSLIGGSGQTEETVSTLTVMSNGYEDVWVPGGGDLRGLRFFGQDAKKQGESSYYSASYGSILTTHKIHPTSRYQVDVVMPKQYSEGQLSGRALAQTPMPENTQVPPSVSAKAVEIVGSVSDPLGQVRAIERYLRDKGYYSNGLKDKTPPGHSAARIDQFLTTTMVGDDEQYSVAMALMLRSLGMPARVVMGMYPDADAAQGGTIELLGADLHAWVEVNFEGLGWVAFDPTPPEDQVPQQEQPRRRNDPKPPVIKPPEDEQRRPDLPQAIEDDGTEKEKETGNRLYAVLMAIAGVSLVLLILALPLLLVIALKVKRATARRQHQDQAKRAAGGWHEILDTAVDMGATISPLDTRLETAQKLDRAQLGGNLVVLAKHVDGTVFGKNPPTEQQTVQLWQEVDYNLAQIRDGQTRWRRFTTRVNLRSLAKNQRTKYEKKLRKGMKRGKRK